MKLMVTFHHLLKVRNKNLFWICSLNTLWKKKITSVKLENLKKNLIKKIQKFWNCDLLCMSGGWSPTVHLFTQSRGKLKYREEDSCFIPDQPHQQTISVGACNGIFDLKSILEDTRKSVQDFLDCKKAMMKKLKFMMLKK